MICTIFNLSAEKCHPFGDADWNPLLQSVILQANEKNAFCDAHPFKYHQYVPFHNHHEHWTSSSTLNWLYLIISPNVLVPLFLQWHWVSVFFSVFSLQIFKKKHLFELRDVTNCSLGKCWEFFSLWNDKFQTFDEFWAEGKLFLNLVYECTTRPK